MTTLEQELQKEYGRHAWVKSAIKNNAQYSAKEKREMLNNEQALHLRKLREIHSKYRIG